MKIKEKSDQVLHFTLLENCFFRTEFSDGLDFV
jgi:hypothetical protein